ncbi:CCNI2 protein, partial [Nothoprocta ornata]|nr:CCNI2 protein [Nothoprocta ornata]
QVMPSVKMLAAQSGRERSPAGILSTGRIILGKLHWDLYTAIPMDFLKIVSTTRPQTNPSRHAALRTRQLQHCSACHQLLQPRGSTLALVIITLELHRLAPDGAPASTDLLRKAQAGS